MKMKTAIVTISTVFSLIVMPFLAAHAQTNVLAVNGTVINSGDPAPADYVVEVTNLDKPVNMDQTMTNADGTYSVGFFDIANPVAQDGDVIEVLVKSKDGTLTLDSVQQTYSDADGATLGIDVLLIESGTITLDSPGPPTWNYTLTHVSGINTSWHYEGAGITGAAVTGDASAAGWQISEQTTTRVTFTNQMGTTSTLSGFEISGNQSGTGSWTAGESNGNIDGSLPVELVTFSAQVRDGNVVLWWQTATETNNLGFHVYRSNHPGSKFKQITPALLPGAGTDSSPHNYQFTDENVQPGEVYYYYIEDVNFNGITDKSSLLEVNLTANRLKVTTRLLVPVSTMLLQNFPNPFNPETWIPYSLAQSADVQLTIYNANGAVIRTINIGQVTAGIYQSKHRAVYWDGRNEEGQSVASGVYFYQLAADDFSATRRMLIRK